jgi:hypothetical protein
MKLALATLSITSIGRAQVTATFAAVAAGAHRRCHKPVNKPLIIAI